MPRTRSGNILTRHFLDKEKTHPFLITYHRIHLYSALFCVALLGTDVSPAGCTPGKSLSEKAALQDSHIYKTLLCDIHNTRDRGRHKKCV